jgi:predicted Zn-dependent protease
LIADEPQNAYPDELKGQMLFEGSRSQDAVQPYRKAVQLAPDVALLKIELAQVEIETGNPALVRDAHWWSSRARSAIRTSPDTWRLLAIAYGRSGDMRDDVLAQA